MASRIGPRIAVDATALPERPGIALPELIVGRPGDRDDAVAGTDAGGVDLAIWAPHLHSYAVYRDDLWLPDRPWDTGDGAHLLTDDAVLVDLLLGEFGPYDPLRPVDPVGLRGHLAERGDRGPRDELDALLQGPVLDIPFVALLRGEAQLTAPERATVEELLAAESQIGAADDLIRGRRSERRWLRTWTSEQGVALRAWLEDASRLSGWAPGLEAAEADTRDVLACALGDADGVWVGGLWPERLRRLVASGR